MNGTIRILFLADSHLGFDLSASPRIARRRRGHDFLANYATALRPALEGDVDLVVHGGDVFHRPRVPSSLAWQAYDPLIRIADRGIPVFIVPGNHERSRLPHVGLARHGGVHVFDSPRTFVTSVRGVRVAVAGFPFERRDVRGGFAELTERTGWRRIRSDAALLCVHQCVEGATVGPADFTFRDAPDVIRGSAIPGGLAAVLSGHIHRHQVLASDLRERPLAAPVLYPGSIERTSLAEMGEPKGYMVLRLATGGGGPRVEWEFRRLPARPMVVREVNGSGLDRPGLDRRVRQAIASCPADAVLRLRVSGSLAGEARRALSIVSLRRHAPWTMNIEVVTDEGRFGGRRDPRGAGSGRRRRRVASKHPQLELDCPGMT